ncbi:hypothetical protein [Dyella agri]|uniref:Uncharacterized protein n=1 Tax=Dyella agri TaxID=1926869 RepID=A0ABW8KII4_9GAMM
MKTHSDPALGLVPRFGEILSDAIGYWERRRIAYNIALAAVVLGWTASAWAELRGQLDVQHLLMLFVLAVLANVCYCAAYLADVPMQLSAFRAGWRRRRWLLWLVGTLFGMALTWFWIADEILPAVGRP